MNCPHCQTPIEDHEASRCLDALIAEKVMGWEPDYENMDGDIPYYNKAILDKGGTHWDRAYRWSSSIEDAMEIIDKVEDHIELRRMCDFGKNPPDYDFNWEWVDWHVQIGSGFGVNKELPLAICRAALYAVSKGE